MDSTIEEESRIEEEVINYKNNVKNHKLVYSCPVNGSTKCVKIEQEEGPYGGTNAKGPFRNAGLCYSECALSGAGNQQYAFKNSEYINLEMSNADFKEWKRLFENEKKAKILKRIENFKKIFFDYIKNVNIFKEKTLEDVQKKIDKTVNYLYEHGFLSEVARKEVSIENIYETLNSKFREAKEVYAGKESWYPKIKNWREPRVTDLRRLFIEELSYYDSYVESYNFASNVGQLFGLLKGKVFTEKIQAFYFYRIQYEKNIDNVSKITFEENKDKIIIKDFKDNFDELLKQYERAKGRITNSTNIEDQENALKQITAKIDGLKFYEQNIHQMSFDKFKAETGLYGPWSIPNNVADSIADPDNSSRPTNMELEPANVINESKRRTIVNDVTEQFQNLNVNFQNWKATEETCYEILCNETKNGKYLETLRKWEDESDKREQEPKTKRRSIDKGKYASDVDVGDFVDINFKHSKCLTELKKTEDLSDENFTKICEERGNKKSLFQIFYVSPS